jgi:quercetin dioxygenase-like cupin family protein
MEVACNGSPIPSSSCPDVEHRAWRIDGYALNPRYSERIMKTEVAFAFLASLLFAPMPCFAQDAVKADAKHYTVEFENAQVRVLRIRYGPHEKGNMHSHRNSVTVFLTDGELRMTMPDGKSTIGTVRAGQAVWEDAGFHQPENLSNQPFEAVRTELKTSTMTGAKKK